MNHPTKLAAKWSPIVAICLAAISAPAHAYSDVPWMAGVLQPFIQRVQDAATNLINGKISQMGTDVSGQVARSGYGVQAEVNKAAIAQKNTAEAIAQYEAQERLRNQAIEVNEKLRQPVTTCATMATADNLGKVDAKVRAASSGRARAATQSMLSQANNGAAILQSYDNSMQKYCTEADAALGRCKVANNPNPKLAGADVQADMLFGAADNPSSSTFISGQADAMKDYIKRITGSLPPEALAARDPREEKTPQGKAYADMARRYAALMSMSTFSLNSIAAAHDAQEGLGDRTMMAGRVGKDASMMAVVKAFVEEKFSAKSMQDQGRQVQAEVILRDMAQTNAFRLWMEYQNLTQTQRIEAMNAMQLALMTEAQLKPQLAAQRAAVASR